MADCRNCGAPATDSDSLGPICCAHCSANPLGCRCQYGEIGVAEMMQWDDYEEDGPLDLEDQLENALDRAFPSSAADREKAND